MHAGKGNRVGEEAVGNKNRSGPSRPTVGAFGTSARRGLLTPDSQARIFNNPQKMLNRLAGKQGD